jgi:hypothetical protein
MGGSVYPVNYVPQAQNGKLTFLQPTSDKLPEGYRIPYADPSSERAMSIGGEDGEPAYLIPSFKYGQPLYNPIEEFRKTGEHLGGPFKTYEEADEWERTVRHPAVENKQNIMFPQEKFQMGGSIPGAVGFSYARTQSPAPSNGKYAKKTMASAQDGNIIPIFKNNKLNFSKPKYDYAWANDKKSLKSKVNPRLNSSEIKTIKDVNKQTLKNPSSLYVKSRDYDLEQSKINNTYYNQLTAQKQEEDRRSKLTKDELERENYNNYSEQFGNISEYVPESGWDRTKAIVSNPLTAFGYAARNQNLPSRFQHGERNTLDNAIDWVNPLQGVAALSEIPGELGRGEYLNAGLSALDAVDLGVYAKGAMKASKPFLQKAGTALGTESGLLSNAYKYNPWAFKLNESNYYRQVSKEAIDDALSSKLIRCLSNKESILGLKRIPLSTSSRSSSLHSLHPLI